VTADWYMVPSRLERVNLTTGTRTLVKELAPADRTGVAACIARRVGDDGRQYTYGYDRRLSTLYQIDGVSLSGR